MTCEGCGADAPPGDHDMHHFAGEKTRRFWLCCGRCFWLVEIRYLRAEAGR